MTPLERIRRAFVDQRYTLTEHAYEEMDADGLDVLDVEAAALTGRIAEGLTDDPRGVRYVVVGTACDMTDAGGNRRSIRRERSTADHHGL